MTAHKANSNPPLESQFIVASDVMRKFMTMVERVARQAGTVLIVGETGTGKERIAHTIHEHSPRSEHALIEVNCAALPEALVESELFGHEKGAFSGADTAKPGLFELAHEGTIFLDEIGELELKIQAKLLRVLDRAPYYRLGGHRKITTDVRVVAATNRNLRQEVSAGRFRKDLYHRLSQFELCVPPLRDRPADIVALAEHLLAQDGSGLQFSQKALMVLQSYAWPGNVRELQNTVNKVIFSASSATIDESEVRQELTNADAIEEDNYEASDSETRLVNLEAQLKSQAIQKALENTGGHRGQAAAQLGISRRTLSRKLRDYGLSSRRSSAPLTLGSLREEERQRFRAELRVAALLITTDGRELNCTTTDLSARGMGLEGLTTPPGHQSMLRICFRFPDSGRLVETLAKLAWADKNGSAGIIFTDVSPATREEIARWLYQKMVEEGWTVPADASESISGHVTDKFEPGTFYAN